MSILGFLITSVEFQTKELRSVTILETQQFYLPETNMAPENGWLEDHCFLLGHGFLVGAESCSF